MINSIKRFSFQKKITAYAQSSNAFNLVVLISFLESSIFPIPPDILIVPMILANRQITWKIAFWCSLASVMGAAAGYGIGYFLYNSVGIWILEKYNLIESFYSFQQSFQEWGFWIIMAKGVTPIPFKLVTIASGVFKLNFWAFMLACAITRFGRFYALSAVLFFFEDHAKNYMEKYIGWILLGMFAIIGLGFYFIKFF